MLSERLLNMALLWSYVTHLPGVSILMAKTTTGILGLVPAFTSMQVLVLAFASSLAQSATRKVSCCFVGVVQHVLKLLQATQAKWKQYRMYDYVVKELPQAIQSLPGIDVNKVC